MYYNFDVEDVFFNYITSLYWAVITMLTVGYGDIAPQTLKERLFAIGVIILSCGVFAYALSKISVIVDEMTK